MEARRARSGSLSQDVLPLLPAFYWFVTAWSFGPFVTYILKFLVDIGYKVRGG